MPHKEHVVDVDGRSHKHHKHKKKHHKHHSKKSSRRHLHSHVSDGSSSDSSSGAEPSGSQRHQVRALTSKHSMRSHHSEATVGSARGALDADASFMETVTARRVNGSGLAPVPDTGSPMTRPLDIDTAVLKKKEVLRRPDEAVAWHGKSGKSGSTRKSLRAKKGSRRDLIQGTKSSMRRLANSVRQVTANNTVTPVETSGSGKLVGSGRGNACCGLRPLPVLLCVLCVMAVVATIVIAVVLASADNTDPPAFKKQGDKCTGLGACTPIEDGGILLRCSQDSICVPAQCLQRQDCSGCQRCLAYKCTSCGQHPVFGCQC